MSPTTRVGQSDPTRGTAPEVVTPGRSAGGWPSSPAPARASAGPRHGGWRPRAGRWHASTWPRTPLRSWRRRSTARPRRPAARAVAVRCDVTDEDGVAAAVTQAREELGHITNLCNIAGVGGFAHTPEQSLAGWDRIIAVNLTGTFLMCRAVLPGDDRARRRHRRTPCRRLGSSGSRTPPPYCASKGGVKLLTKALAVEYMARGVRVNGVAPGGVDTPIIHNFGPPADADFKLIERIMTPIGFAYPHEIAGAFAYLGSDEAGLRQRRHPLHRRGDHDLNARRGTGGADSARLRVALDATPLLGLPTGVGAFCDGALRALAERPGLDVRAFAVSWRRRSMLDERAAPRSRRGAATDAGPAAPCPLVPPRPSARRVVRRAGRRRARDELRGPAHRWCRRRGLGPRPHPAPPPRAVR